LGVAKSTGELPSTLTLRGVRRGALIISTDGLSMFAGSWNGSEVVIHDHEIPIDASKRDEALKVRANAVLAVSGLCLQPFVAPIQCCRA